MKQTISIGIAAYNEEKNIGALLSRISKLSLTSVNLMSIVVVDDASTDDTGREIQKIRNKKIHLITNSSRKGKAHCLDKISKIVNSDLLVLFDADVVIKDDQCIDKLVNPIINGDASLTSCEVRELRPSNFVAEALKKSMEIKKNMFLSIDNGNNIYTCHGRARALSKEAYSKLTFKSYLADDAYSYLWVKNHSMKYEYVHSTCVYYKVPSTINDHLKQSMRFFGAKKQLIREFGKDCIDQEYKIPLRLLVSKSLKGFVQNPIITVFYIAVTAYSLIASTYYRLAWGTADSTK